MRKTEKLKPEDLKWLANQWEDLMAEISYPSRKLAIHVLWRLTDTYMRGQGKRVGNSAGFHKYAMEAVALHAQVLQYIEQHESRDIYFPRVVALGFDSIEHTNEILIEMSARGKEKED